MKYENGQENIWCPTKWPWQKYNRFGDICHRLFTLYFSLFTPQKRPPPLYDHLNDTNSVVLSEENYCTTLYVVAF